MSTDRETTRVVRSWLEDGATRLPDRVLDSVLERLPATPQRRPPWPAWRFVQMHRSVQAALGAAAIVVVAIVGMDLTGTGPGGAGTSPSPAPTASPGPASTPMMPPTGSGARPMAAGTYLAEGLFELKVGFTLPAGWQGNVGGPYLIALERSTPDTGGVYLQILGDLYADPCHRDSGFASPPVGPAGADLVSALTRLPGVTATLPIDSTIGGYAGKALDLRAASDPTGCTDGVISLWQLPLGAIAGLAAGQTDHVWVVDVGSKRLVIEADEYAGETAAQKAEVQGVLDSLTIAP